LSDAKSGEQTVGDEGLEEFDELESIPQTRVHLKRGEISVEVESAAEVGEVSELALKLLFQVLHADTLPRTMEGGPVLAHTELAPPYREEGGMTGFQP
jgi:hypothetical protein